MFPFLHLFTPYRNRLRVNYGRTNHSTLVISHFINVKVKTFYAAVIKR